MEALNEAVRLLAPRSVRRKTGASIVFSVRLDPAELAALEARAVVAGVRPSVLARNLIRTGLAAARGPDVAAAVDRLEGVVAELRAAVS
jgi:S-adenosylmethionine:diacylglycerol 3-amino-3-carboxypropyl transferase